VQQRADGPRTNLTHCQRRSRSSALTVDEDGPVGYKRSLTLAPVAPLWEGERAVRVGATGWGEVSCQSEEDEGGRGREVHTAGWQVMHWGERGWFSGRAPVCLESAASDGGPAPSQVCDAVSHRHRRGSRRWRWCG
jgi:hypothetical protein